LHVRVHVCVVAYTFRYTYKSLQRWKGTMLRVEGSSGSYGNQRSTNRESDTLARIEMNPTHTGRPHLVSSAQHFKC
jgi:hypothetical protein